MVPWLLLKCYLFGVDAREAVRMSHFEVEYLWVVRDGDIEGNDVPLDGFTESAPPSDCNGWLLGSPGRPESSNILWSRLEVYVVFK